VSFPPPNVWGLPFRFSEWRKHQDEATQSLLDDEPRFLAQNCPTGFGKSLVYLTAAKILDRRTLILTSTKGLQTQLMNEFGRVKGVAEIRGRSNYVCRLNSKTTCDNGVCTYGVKCKFRDEGGCEYYDAVKTALRSDIVITNYAYWMSQMEYSSGLGSFDLMVLDEAHDAPEHLLNHLAVRFDRSNAFESRMLNLKKQVPKSLEEWSNLAASLIPKVQDVGENAKVERNTRKFVSAKRLLGKLERLMSVDASWVFEDDGQVITLTPTWPAPHAEDHLFYKIPKVFLTSATIIPKTLDLLGISKAERRFEEYPSTFPIGNRHLIHVPTVRMNYKNTEAENRLWLVKGDAIIAPRLERKGIIHTVSYARRDMIIDNSRFSKYMITHNSKNAEEVVKAFKKAPPPLILVSPSMATGWDFPDDECRWQWIVKLPFPDTRGAVMSRRVKEDKQFQMYLVMQQLIQAVGRGVRSEDDWCETFITDNSIQWFLSRNKSLTVESFAGAYIVRYTPPKPRGIVH
jgi:Rad3-related DNA helicase